MSFKLNLKPAVAYANSSSEQNAVDAVTREAEIEERARSHSAHETTENSLNCTGNGTTSRGEDDEAQTDEVKETNEEETTASKPTAVPPFAMKKLSIPLARHVDPTSNANDSDSVADSSSAPVTNSAREAAPAPSLGVPGLRLNFHNNTNNNQNTTNSTAGSARGSVSVINSARYAASNNSNSNVSPVEDGALSSRSPRAGPPLYRKSTVGTLRGGAVAGGISSTATSCSPRPNPSGGAAAASGPPLHNTPGVPSFSLALGKLSNSPNPQQHHGRSVSGLPARRTSMDLSTASTAGGGGAVTQTPFVFTKYNPEIEKPVEVDEQDDFLTAVEDLPDDPQELKAQLSLARRELLGWDVRFDAMRDHYHDHVAKLVAFMEHEQQRALAQSSAARLSPSGSPHQQAHTFRPTGAENSSTESPRAGGHQRSGSFYQNTQTARGNRNGVLVTDTAMQTDITVDVLNVMIKYPQSVRGERGNTRATSPAVGHTIVNNSRVSTLRTSQLSTKHLTKPSPSPSGAHRASVATSPTVSIGGSSTIAGRKSGGGMLMSALGGRASLGASGTRLSGGASTMNRSVLSTNSSSAGSGGVTASGARVTGRSRAKDPEQLNASGSHGHSQPTSLTTSRNKNRSDLLSVASDVPPRPRMSVTPRASISASGHLMTSRGASPAVSISNASQHADHSNNARNTVPPPTSRLAHSSQRAASAQSSPAPAERPPIQIPAQLSTSSYIKPGNRKFGTASGGASLTTSRGGAASPTPDRLEGSTLSYLARGDSMKPLDFGGSLTTNGGLSGYDASNTGSLAHSPHKQQQQQQQQPAATDSGGIGSTVSSVAASPSGKANESNTSGNDVNGGSGSTAFAPRQIISIKPGGVSRYPPVSEHLPAKSTSKANSQQPSPDTVE